MSEIIFGAKHQTIKATGRPVIIVTTNVKDHWFTAAAWNAKGYSLSLPQYTGGDLDVDYYAKGDLLLDKTSVCTEGGKLVRDFYASPNPEVTARAVAASEQMKERALLVSISKFAKNKPVPKTATETPKETPVVTTTETPATPPVVETPAAPATGAFQELATPVKKAKKAKQVVVVEEDDEDDDDEEVAPF